MKGKRKDWCSAHQKKGWSRAIPCLCPTCKKDIFYFECSCGSRVFFDKLGPPWPVHDCEYSPKPDNALIYIKQGMEKVKLDQHSDAIADFDIAIVFDPNNALAFHNRGVAKAKLRQYDDAIADYDTAIRLKPNNALAYMNRGAAKYNSGQTLEAKQDWQTALKLALRTGNIELKSKIESHLRLYK